MPKVYLDQGHNPVNPNAGAEGNGFREQNLVYTIGQMTASLLRANGVEVRLSRPTPETQLGASTATSLAARVNEANSWGADLFVSLHNNSSNITSASGNEAYIYSRNSSAERAAQSILTELTAITGLPNRGIFARPTLYVLRKTRMPAVLVEMGFISNPGDAALLAYSPNLFAESLSRGIQDYFAGF